MALGYDGTIRIDSKINSKNFNTGIASMVKSLRGLALAVGIAFGVGAVINFGKAAVETASNMSSALVGLQSVVEGTGNSWAQAKGFIDDFISDGLVPATDAVTAYKNLLMRGYNVQQIEQVLNIFKDTASFGRQSALTMGQAISRATEGLKNENSLLVDNVGITKNVAKMWEDYAKKIGTSATNLTKAQKIQAEIEGIVAESRFQLGDAAKLANTYAGKISALGVSFTNLKVAIGNSIIPIITRIIPYIKAAVDALTVFFNKIATVMSIFFDVDISAKATSAGMSDMADSSTDAAASQEDLADGLKESKKAAQGALAAFDELNVLQQPDTQDKPAAETPALNNIATVDTAKVDDSLDAMKERIQRFRDRLLTLLEPARAAFGRLLEALKPLGKTVWEGLKWAWDNILVPLGKWVITTALPVFLDLLAVGVTYLNKILIGLKPAWQWFWDNVLKPVLEFTGEGLIAFLGMLSDSINRVSTAFDEGGFLAAFTEGLKVMADFWVRVILGFLAIFMEGFLNLLIWFSKEFVLPILAKLGDMWKTFIDKARTALTDFKTLWSTIGAWFLSFVADSIVNGFKTAFGGVKTLAKGTVNFIIDLVNGMLQAIGGGINAIVSMLNNIQVDIPEWIPIYGGQTWSMSIPSVAVPRIPRLATGAVIPPNAQFAAILGDQRSGKNIEAPEALIRQLLQEELGNIQAKIDINFVGSLAQLVRELKPHIDREDVRVGKSLVSSGVSV